ncbi:MAG: (Fe-S)-binding protein [Chromatiales bacterium]|nr:(Fe-S)-binding protein [Chromatiales bacterium]
MTPMPEQPNVGLFVTCLVDLYRPNVGFAAVDLLEDAGCRVFVPSAQTCCGQPAYNSGDASSAQSIARQVIETFEEFDYVVGPSGSCMGMLKEHFATLFPVEPHWERRARALGERCYELMSFLTDVMAFDSITARYDGTVTYHDACSGLRELGVKSQPRALLDKVEGLNLAELTDGEVCCGFGGTFCVKHPEISARLVSDKCADIEASGADTLLAGDMGCLMNLAGRLKRLGSSVKVYHAAEVLAGRTGEAPPIAEGSLE